MLRMIDVNARPPIEALIDVNALDKNGDAIVRPLCNTWMPYLDFKPYEVDLRGE